MAFPLSVPVKRRLAELADVLTRQLLAVLLERHRRRSRSAAELHREGPGAGDVDGAWPGWPRTAWPRRCGVARWPIHLTCPCAPRFARFPTSNWQDCRRRRRRCRRARGSAGRSASGRSRQCVTAFSFTVASTGRTACGRLSVPAILPASFFSTSGADHPLRPVRGSDGELPRAGDIGVLGEGRPGHGQQQSGHECEADDGLGSNHDARPTFRHHRKHAYATTGPRPAAASAAAARSFPPARTPATPITPMTIGYQPGWGPAGPAAADAEASRADDHGEDGRMAERRERRDPGREPSAEHGAERAGREIGGEVGRRQAPAARHRRPPPARLRG